MALTQVKAAGLTADSIDETKLADNSIDSEHYNDGSIDTAHLADDAITGAKISNNAIATAKIPDDAVTQAKLADDAVGTAQISGNAVTTAKIVDDNITQAKIAAGAVGGTELSDNSVTLAKMAGGTDGTIISYDASGDPVAVGPGTDGQVLTSTGAGSPPAFEDASGGATINNATENEIVTVASTTSQLDAESNLTFDGEAMSITHEGTSTPENQLTLDTSAVTDGGGSGIFFKNSGATGNAHLNRYGTRLHTVRSSNGASSFKISNEKTGGTTGLIEAVDIDPDQNVKISTGNLVIGTSGKGIDFGATAGPAAGTGTQELLDDYEEGTWTPDVRFNDSSASGQANAGHYVKIGRMVYASYKFTLTDKGSGDGQFHLNGFPFAPKTGYSDIGGHFGYFHRFADTDNTNGQVYQQFYSSIMYFAFRGLNANTTRLTDDNFRDDTACSGMIVYYTDA